MRFPRVILIVAGWGTLATACGFSAPEPSFTQSLSAEERARLGLAALTPEQLGELDRAVANYRDAKAAAVATQAVETYKRQEQPAAIQRAVELAKTQEAERQPERFSAMIPGRFTGWDGRTRFVLDNGQVWMQASADVYAPKARQDAAVVIYKNASGYWRLRVLDDEGAWVTVKRVQ